MELACSCYQIIKKIQVWVEIRLSNDHFIEAKFDPFYFIENSLWSTFNYEAILILNVFQILIIQELKRFELSLVEFDNEQEVKTLFDDGRFFAWFRKNDFRNVPNILEYLLWNIEVEHIEHHHYHSITRISKYVNID